MCTSGCGGAFYNWLTSRECQGQSGAELTAFGLSDIICATNGNSESTKDSCLFSNSSGRVDDALIGTMYVACRSWFLNGGACPNGTGCDVMLKTAVDRIGCCYNNFFNTTIAVRMITE